MSTFITAKRLIKSGLINFFRNIWVSIAATSMVAITLFIISTIIILYVLTVLSIENSTDKVGVVTAYFKDQTTEKEINNIRDEITAMPGVKSVGYTSKQQAEELFKQRHANEPLLLATLDEYAQSERPLPASVAVRAQKLVDYSQIYQSLTSEKYSPYFAQVRDSEKVINKLHRIIDFITRFGILLAGIFMIVTVLVTFNTIRLTIYNRREEVEIMRLVGATNWYIRWPFFIESVLYAIFATAITSLIVLGLLILLSDRIVQFLSISSLGTSLIRALFWQILAVNLGASIILNIVASTIAIRKYLRI